MNGARIHVSRDKVDGKLTCCLEGSCSDDEPLEEKALLEVESVSKGFSDVGGVHVEGDGDEALLEDVVHLEVADNAALTETREIYR